jgi:autoinducer 2-degrading protein
MPVCFCLGEIMHITLVHVQVKPDHIDDFIAATRLNHEASIRESGNRRFDVLQSPEKPTQFILYEAYATAEDAAAHKETAHYLAWRDMVADWMAEPRQGVRYNGLLPKG